MSVLVIAPHMDDEVLGCGGVLQRFDKPKVIFATMGGNGADKRLNELGEYVAYSTADRREEMARAAGLIGYEGSGVAWAPHSLDELPTRHVVDWIERSIEATPNVELLFVPGPSHDQDHVAIRRAVEAVIRPHCFAGSVLEYWTWGSPAPYDPQVVIPLSAKEMALKVSALLQYRTQLEPGGPTYPYGRESQTAYMLANGRLVAKPFAEVFTPRRLVPNETTARLFRGW